MKQLLTLGLLVVSLMGHAASGDHSPRLYYNRFHKELTNFKALSMVFYQSNLLNADTKTIDANLAKVTRQLHKSRARILAAPVYKGDAELRDGYLQGIDSLHYIFEVDFARAQNLRRYRNQSYRQRMAYHKAFDQAELKTQKAQNNLIEMELQFAAKYGINLQYDAKDEVRYKQYQMVSTHCQRLTSLFAKIDHGVQDYLTTAQNKPNQNLSGYGLSDSIAALNDKTHLSIEAAKDDMADALDDALQKELLSYLKMVKKETKSTLRNISKTLETEPYYSTDFKNAQIDLQFFSESYAKAQATFEQKRIQWLQAQFEEIEKNVLVNQ